VAQLLRGDSRDFASGLRDLRRVRYGLAVGSADLIGSLRVRVRFPGGEETVEISRFIALEIKRPGEKLRPEQERWAQVVRAHSSGFVAVVTSEEEALAAIERARRGFLS
jgi:hypothetical protein